MLIKSQSEVRLHTGREFLHPFLGMPLCTEKQARAAVYSLTRNVRIQYSPQLSVDQGVSPRTSTRKCMLENQLSLGSDNAWGG